MKAEATKARRVIKAKLLAFSEVGPFGSCDHAHPLDTTSVLEDIRRPGSNLVDIWRKKSIYDWVKQLEEPPKTFRKPSACEENMNETLLLGGKCASCRKSRIATLRSLSGFRTIITDGYKAVGLGSIDV